VLQLQLSKIYSMVTCRWNTMFKSHRMYST